MQLHSAHSYNEPNNVGRIVFEPQAERNSI